MDGVAHLGGIGIDTVEAEVQAAARGAFPTRGDEDDELDSGGEYQWRRDGEYHLFNPQTPSTSCSTPPAAGSTPSTATTPAS